MKQNNLWRISYILLLAALLPGCRREINQQEYLGKVVAKLETIQSAFYHTVNESWNPGDTVATAVHRRFVKEYHNPSDTTIGAAFVVLDPEDHTLLQFAYDGQMRALVYHEHRGIVIDDFTRRPLPFRPVSPPFFNYTRNILRYALNTEDSIVTEFADQGDHWFFRLTIMEDRQVEFFGQAHFIPENPYFTGDPTSIYEFWIDKSDGLPFKVRREMAHNISVVTCLDPEFNTGHHGEFNAYAYFPSDYEVREYAAGTAIAAKEEMLGKAAPEWELNNSEGQPVALKDLDSKVLLIMFTGIGCGPCQAAIPFLKQMVSDLDDEDFGLVAIESWVRNAHSLQNYVERNQLNYPLLSATDEVIDQFSAGRAVPVFYILDKDRIIRKVVRGYSPDSTGAKILEEVTRWLGKTSAPNL
jgi:peroxiredoxin